MQMTRDQAKATIEGLVKRFREHREEYHTADYNETKTRIGLINPFFHALGWDVSHEEDRIESYREVIHEDKVRVKGQMKAPDYGFRVAGQSDKRLFFVEAKKPSVSLKTNREASYQLRIYGRSAQAPVSILTNFEEFIIYDCTRSPKQSDSASSARIKYIHFEDYIKEFDFLYDTFSHEAVYSGHFDKFVQSDTYKKGTQTLDKDFVESLDSWRKYLATSIALENKKLNEEEINFVVQQTIDRLIFLRFCEDRGVEQYGQLQKAVSHGNSYDNLYDLFKRADDKYNSGLFDFKKDSISEKLTIKNKVLKKIIEDLYYPSPYVFRVMPVEVLGNAYEQFLGKVIRITSSHSARIEVKPEVRKAGGVYYTPQYIVEYIVKNTVGKLIEGKTPKEIAQLKIVDPACGSGSFLIGAFQYLVQYHVNWYHHHPAEAKKAKALAPSLTGKNGGGLTTSEKKKILLNNIFGVDIDANAVEVTKLSLLLKCMEGETEASIKQQLSVFHERILPDLDNNIKNGNSLIDLDEEFDFDSSSKIHPFNWKKGFPDVFKNGAFDVVIGNPPYGAEFSEEQKKYLLKKYSNQNYQLDSYLIFLEQSVKVLLKNDGNFGMIIPNPWLTNLLQKGLRKFIFETVAVNEIVHFKDPVFPDVTVDTEIILLSKKNPKSNKVRITVVEKGKPLFNGKHTEFIHSQKEWIDQDGEVVNIFLNEFEKKLFKKTQEHTKPLETYIDINVGIKPYQVGKGNPKQTRGDVENRVFDSDKKKDKAYRKYLRGKDMNRYVINALEERYIKFGEWLAEPRQSANFDAPEKIFMRQTGDSLIATLDKTKLLCLNNMHVLVPKENTKVSLLFLLGIINSKTLNWYYQTLNPEKGEALAEVKKTNVANLPIREIDFENKFNKEKHDEIVKHVDLLLKLNEEFQEEKLQSKTEHLKQRIEHSEEKINQLVYELYNLTDKEIKIIEGKQE
ncbi:MAG: N-6 DNA methylase [Bacteroidetes bacterium]|nr:N-6 DNA methylase [Bacteroidota bacterium]